MTYWYKASNTLIDDPKLRIISNKYKFTHAVTIATFHALLQRCSNNSSEIFTNDVKSAAEEIDLQLDISNSSDILQAFQDRGIIDGCKLLKWNDYQANTSTQRVREWREKKSDETLRNVTATNVTQTRLDKTRLEKKEDNLYADKDFELFWEVYPSTKSKQGSYKAFLKAKKILPAAELISAAEKYRDECLREKREQQHIAHGSSWLNAARWEDYSPENKQLIDLRTVLLEVQKQSVVKESAARQAYMEGNDEDFRRFTGYGIADIQPKRT